MTARRPPRAATWLLEQFGPRPGRESLVGDLIEQYDAGRSAMWYWREALSAICASVAADLWHHPFLALRAVVLYWIATDALVDVTGALQHALFPWFNQDWDSEFLRQLWVYYGLPFYALVGLGLFYAGRFIARWHDEQREAILLLCVAFQIAMSIPWALETARRLDAGLIPFWDYKRALIFQAVMNFAGLPMSFLAGGLRQGQAGRVGPPDLTIVTRC